MADKQDIISDLPDEILALIATELDLPSLEIL